MQQPKKKYELSMRKKHYNETGNNVFVQTLPGNSAGSMCFIKKLTFVNT